MSAKLTNRSSAFVAALIAVMACCAISARAGSVEPPPDPGFEISVQAADAIVDADIIAGGPFRAVAMTRKVIKGGVPAVFELEGFNSYNWDTVHRGFAAGTRFILFLSKTNRPDVFATLTPAAPRLSVQQDGVLLQLGDPPFRVPVKRAAMEEALALMLEQHAGGKVPERAEVFIRGLWESGDIEPRYLAVALSGALRDPRTGPILIDASKDKLLKLRLTAIEALGKVDSAQTRAALRALLKDEKATVSREAARVLAGLRDTEALPDLMAWAIKTTAQKLAAEPKSGSDPNAAKAESAALDIVRFAATAGPLMDTDVLVRPLLEIVRGPNENLAREALYTMLSVAQPEQVPALQELAEDRLYSLRGLAGMTLARLTLSPAETADEFRAWWEQNKKAFSEDFKRDRVESAAKALARDDGTERRTPLDLVKAAPAEISLVSIAPLLLKDPTSKLLSADEIAAWNSPLAVPFLIERLGRYDAAERRDALAAVVQLCVRNPRLADVLWPLIRAHLSEEHAGTRRTAESACSRLMRPDGIDALLNTVQYNLGSDSNEASKGLYQLTARTLGFSYNEPVPDANAARRRLRGWWENAVKPFKPVAMPHAQSVTMPRMWPDLDAAARAAKLDALVLANDSRQSAAAFWLAFSERPAGDALWKKLLAQSRQRDKAHGLLGLIGGDGSLSPDLVKRLVSIGDGAEPPLCRALTIIALASLKTSGKPAGAEKIVDWLRGEGAKADLPWRRLAIVSLGLADGDAKSLAYLEELIKNGLMAKAPDPDVYSSEPLAEDYALLIPALTAVCARNDGTALLMAVLNHESTTKREREVAARALSLRRHEPAVAGIAKALESATRYEWQNYCRTLDPLLKPEHAGVLNALLDTTHVPARSAAAFMLAGRPEIGNDAETRGHLVTGLGDTSAIVRYYCAVALGKRRAVSAIKNLTELLRDDDDDVKAGAAEALGLIGDKEACMSAALAAELMTRIDIRWLRALAIAGNEDHIAALLKFCNSSSYVEQRAGVEALGASSDPGVLQALLKVFRNDEAAMQTVAADALAQRGDQTVEALRADLAGEDRAVRARALHMLSRIDTKGSRAALARAANDADPAIKALAAFALKRIESDSAAPAAGTLPKLPNKN